MSDNELLAKAKETHPEAINDIEAVDLLALDVHREAMKAKDQDHFYKLTVLYNSLRLLYQNLLNNTIVVS